MPPELSDPRVVLAAPVAIVESMHDHGLREINALESQIARAEDDADAALWEQARRVTEQLDAGLSQRALARQWINARTGQCYDEKHVRLVRKALEARAEFTPQARPRFRELYNDLANPKTCHVAHNTGDAEWFTPAEYAEAARAVLGTIDLDPASCAEANAVIRATRYYSAADNGLEQPWRGRVYMNPPYATTLIEQFATRLADAVEAGEVTEAITLTNNATETAWFDRLMSVAAGVCFPRGRVKFWHGQRTSSSPLQGQAVTYSGPNVPRFCSSFSRFGKVWIAP